jgi:hypothetical protein
MQGDESKRHEHRRWWRAKGRTTEPWWRVGPISHLLSYPNQHIRLDLCVQRAQRIKKTKMDSVELISRIEVNHKVSNSGDSRSMVTGNGDVSTGA